MNIPRFTVLVSTIQKSGSDSLKKEVYVVQNKYVQNNFNKSEESDEKGDLAASTTVSSTTTTV